ncbi:MAG: hypothetical protein L0387_25500 [Acidobacteria bacterium]|nr:hypothetical protein [Acidobacteriota bacterium]
MTFLDHNAWPTWIGFTDNEVYGGFESFGQPNPEVDGWIWVTGEPVTFTGWNPGNPDNTIDEGQDEDFALLGNGHGDKLVWNDQPGGEYAIAPFVVEYERLVLPESLPFALTVFALIGTCVASVFSRRCAQSTR